MRTTTEINKNHFEENFISSSQSLTTSALTTTSPYNNKKNGQSCRMMANNNKLNDILSHDEWTWLSCDVLSFIICYWIELLMALSLLQLRQWKTDNSPVIDCLYSFNTTFRCLLTFIIIILYYIDTTNCWYYLSW